MSAEYKSSKPEISILMAYNGIHVELSMQQLMELAKAEYQKQTGATHKDLDKMPNTIALIVKKEDKHLIAETYPYETEYPGINVDATHDAHKLYITNIELPSVTCPKAITARLYAGYDAFETDGPIAIVKHTLQDKATLKALTTRAKEGKPMPTKLVYIDTDVSQFRPWHGAPEDLAEHQES